MQIENPVILVVDDSPDDALLMNIVFERIGMGEPLRFADGGEAAITYLRGDGVHLDRLKYPLPVAVLLDLNMPRINGFDVLIWIRAQPALRQLRVFILSASSRPEDIRLAYDLGADAYLVKPRNLDELMLMARSLIAWLRLSHFAPLPGASARPDFPLAGSGALPKEARDPASRQTGVGHHPMGPGGFLR